MLNSSQQEDTPQEDIQSGAIMQELAGSLNSILEFAGFDLDMGESFRKHVNTYKAMEDKNSTEDSAIRLRKQITGEFYSLYAITFEAALAAPYLPMPVRMFLYFGYVDEDLAGAANCIALYNLACGIVDQSSFGIYTTAKRVPAGTSLRKTSRTTYINRRQAATSLPQNITPWRRTR